MPHPQAVAGRTTTYAGMRYCWAGTSGRLLNRVPRWVLRNKQGAPSRPQSGIASLQLVWLRKVRAYHLMDPKGGLLLRRGVRRRIQYRYRMSIRLEDLHRHYHGGLQFLELSSQKSCVGACPPT